MEYPKPENLSQVLKDPQLRGAFRAFCEDQLAGENFLFWEECEEFQKIDGEDERRVCFHRIYDKYLSLDSDTEMNISGVFLKGVFWIYSKFLWNSFLLSF